MAVGTVATLTTMVVVGDIFANEPIYVGLASGLVVFLAGSLATRPTDPEILAEWDRRSRGSGGAAAEGVGVDGDAGVEAGHGDDRSAR
jgi:SSS family solute:Na+ symporter